MDDVIGVFFHVRIDVKFKFVLAEVLYTWKNGKKTVHYRVVN